MPQHTHYFALFTATNVYHYFAYIDVPLQNLSWADGTSSSVRSEFPSRSRSGEPARSFGKDTRDTPIDSGSIGAWRERKSRPGADGLL